MLCNDQGRPDSQVFFVCGSGQGPWTIFGRKFPPFQVKSPAGEF
jgi:hypothetical protein